MACLLLFPGSAPAQSDEVVAAARALYEDGRAHFKSQRYADALEKFQRARQLADNHFLRYYMGRTLAALERCHEALRILEPLAGEVKDAGAEAERVGDVVRCHEVRARDLLAEGRCDGAAEYAARLPVEAQRGLAAALGRCEPAAPFPLDTTEGRVALTLMWAARDERRAGDVLSALALYRKALALADEPFLRAETFELVLGEWGCEEAAALWQELGATRVEDRHRLTLCTTLAPPREVEPARQRAYATPILVALAARDAGELARARQAVEEALAVTRTPAASALLAELFFEGGDCVGFRRTIDAAGGVGALPLERGGERLLECNTRTVPPPKHEMRVAGWTLVGAGAAAGVAAVAMSVLWRLADDEQSAAESANDKSAAWTASDRAFDYSAAAYTLMGVGAASLGVGIALVVVAGQGQPPQDLGFAPLLSPGAAGGMAFGRF